MVKFCALPLMFAVMVSLLSAVMTVEAAIALAPFLVAAAEDWVTRISNFPVGSDASEARVANPSALPPFATSKLPLAMTVPVEGMVFVERIAAEDASRSMVKVNDPVVAEFEAVAVTLSVSELEVLNAFHALV
jgi:hypothetical protein